MCLKMGLHNTIPRVSRDELQSVRKPSHLPSALAALIRGQNLNPACADTRYKEGNDGG